MTVTPGGISTGIIVTKMDFAVIVIGRRLFGWLCVRFWRGGRGEEDWGKFLGAPSR